MKKIELLAFLIVALGFIIGFYLYPALPDAIPTHWDANGNVNAYSDKSFVFFLPVLSLVLVLLFVVIPAIDPLRKNIEQFRMYYDMFILLFVLFMFYIYLLTLAWTMGFTFNGSAFNMMQALSPAIAVLFYYAGVLMGHAKQNWFIGIRTPWTMSNETVWDKTHKMGGKLFRACGVIALLGIFFPNVAILFILVPIIAVAVYTVVYSYQEYQKIKNTNNK